MRIHLCLPARSIAVVLIVTSLAALCLGSRPALGQDPDSRPPGVQQPPLPIMPQRPSRPAQGSAAPERWQQPDEPKDKPVASLFEAVRGNDAALEVVVGIDRIVSILRSLVRSH